VSSGVNSKTKLKNARIWRYFKENYPNHGTFRRPAKGK